MKRLAFNLMNQHNESKFIKSPLRNVGSLQKLNLNNFILQETLQNENTDIIFKINKFIFIFNGFIHDIL